MSAGQVLKRARFRRPLLLLSLLHVSFILADGHDSDGIIPELCMLQECMSNENTVLAVTLHGGHVAFLKGLWPFGTAWMDQVAIQFLTMCSDMTSQNQFDAT